MSCQPNICPQKSSSSLRQCSLRFSYNTFYVPVLGRNGMETAIPGYGRSVCSAAGRTSVPCLFARCGSGPWFSQIAAQLSNPSKLLWTEYAFTQAQTGVRRRCQGVRSLYKGRLFQELVGLRSTRVHFNVTLFQRSKQR